jgi:hypothetical protein
MSAECQDCDHISRLDLSRLVTLGYGDVPLIELPLKWVCESRRSTISVTGQVGAG